MVKYSTDPDELAAQVAEAIAAPRDAIADITIDTDLGAASTLEVQVIDLDYAITEGGKLTPRARKQIDEVKEAGHGAFVLPLVEVNYPLGSRWWWRLTDVETDFGEHEGANVTLTFEPRIVAYMRHHHGPPVLSVSRGNATRAQFIKMMTDEVRANGGIRFISPELEDVQPILRPEE